MSTFAQGTPTVPSVISASNIFLVGNTTSGTALSVQQLGAGGAVASFSNATGSVGLFVSSTSQVGVGTTDPATALQVAGDLLLSQGAAKFGYNSMAIQYDGNTNYGSIIGKSVKWDGTNYIVQTDGATPRCCAIQMSFDQGFKFVTTSASGASNLALSPAQFGSNVKMAITLGGNVGIGTNNPGYTLQVYKNFALSGSTVINNMADSGTASNVARSDWLTVAQTNPYTIITSYNFAGAGSTYQYIPFYISGNPIALTGGNVGIGTVSPSAGGVGNSLGGALLDVYKSGTGVSSNVNISAGCDGSASSTNQASVIFNIKGAGGGIVNGGITHQLLGSNYGFNFQPLTLGTSVMVIKGDGNVGIGTTNPQNTLNVVGSANVYGQLTYSTQPYLSTVSLSVAGSAAAGWYRIASISNTARAKFRFETFGGGIQESVCVTTTCAVAYNTGWPSVRIDDQTIFNAGNNALSGGQIRMLSSQSSGNYYLELYLASIAAAYTLYVYVLEGDPRNGAPTLSNPIVAGSVPGSYNVGPTVPINGFSVSTSTTTSMNAAFLITSSGNVGIGTNSPGYILHVNTTATTGQNIASFFSPNLASGGQSLNILLGTGQAISQTGVITYLNYGTNSTNVMQFSMYGVSGSSININVTGVGIGTTSPGYQLDLSTDGARKLTSTTWLTGSDQRIKTDVQSANLQTCYDTVKSIDLKYFKWNFPPESNVTVDDQHSLGFIAQEVQKVFPNAVSESNSYGYTDFLSLNTDQILKAMYGALKQTMADKERLEQSLISATANISSLEQSLETSRVVTESLSARLAALEARA